MRKTKKIKNHQSQNISRDIYKEYKLKCKKCKGFFGVDENYVGVITCPYCGELVEQS